MAEEVKTGAEWKRNNADLMGVRKDTDVYLSGEIISIPDKRLFLRQYFAASWT
jgi:hypothetical protein